MIQFINGLLKKLNTRKINSQWVALMGQAYQGYSWEIIEVNKDAPAKI